LPPAQPRRWVTAAPRRLVRAVDQIDDDIGDLVDLLDAEALPPGLE
jgi:hypothetical protein